LAEVAVHRFVPQAGAGVVLVRRYLLSVLTAGGLMSPIEDVAVPAALTIPERAFGKRLTQASVWLAHGGLGPKAWANFELANDLDPIDSAGRSHFEIKVRRGRERLRRPRAESPDARGGHADAAGHRRLRGGGCAAPQAHARAGRFAFARKRKRVGEEGGDGSKQD
jgi:hypothetical protein